MQSDDTTRTSFKVQRTRDDICTGVAGTVHIGAVFVDPCTNARQAIVHHLSDCAFPPIPGTQTRRAFHISSSTDLVHWVGRAGSCLVFSHGGMASVDGSGEPAFKRSCSAEEIEVRNKADTAKAPTSAAKEAVSGEGTSLSASKGYECRCACPISYSHG